MSSNSIHEMQSEDWYTKAVNYWESVDTTNNGMLGGLEIVDKPDVIGSIVFLREFITSKALKTDLACDCGAGIGRVSNNMLLKLFKKVDLVEQNGKFLETAKQEPFANKVEKFVNLGLQSFTPEKGRYDLIWCQWVLGHLTDEDLVSFFIRCRESGCKFIAIKENIARQTVYFDSEDSSVNRTDPLYKTIFEKAGLELVKEEVQKGFPDYLFPVKMYMLQPKK